MRKPTGPPNPAGKAVGESQDFVELIPGFGDVSNVIANFRVWPSHCVRAGVIGRDKVIVIGKLVRLADRSRPHRDEDGDVTRLLGEVACVFQRLTHSGPSKTCDEPFLTF